MSRVERELLGAAPGTGEQPLHVVVRQERGLLTRLVGWLFWLALLASLAGNAWMYQSQRDYFARSDPPSERFHSGDRLARDKLAIIRVTGTIMPPVTDRVLESIRQAKEDDQVKGVLLAVDSPGGLVTDSHQIYHRLRELTALKPVFVSMGSLAASGGYYVSMGAGPEAKIFAEPTTWTGSIGVIIPHYEVAGLAGQLGVEAIPLKTGEFKDALSPFRKMTDRDREVWGNILDQSFQQFLEVIDLNRSGLDRDQVRALATGQIYTAKDALQNGLVDALGYEEDALDALRRQLGLAQARVVTYEHRPGLLSVALRFVKPAEPVSPWQALLDSAMPRALYLASWPALPRVE